MQSQEVCQILKQILPELEAKIKQDLKNEYQLKIQQIQEYYQQQMVKLAHRHQSITKQLTAQYQSRYVANEADDKEKQQLYKRVSVLEAQRKNWNQLQSQYQITIQNLTNQLTNISQNTNNQFKTKQSKECERSLSASYVSNDFSSVSPIPPPITQIKYSFPVSKWNHRPKNSNNEQNISQPFKKDKQYRQQASQSLNTVTNIKKEESNKKQKSYKQDSLKKYIKQEQADRSNDNKSHYNSVLSPPKQQAVKAKKIFWDEGKKKQLLSMIKLS